MFQHIPSKAVIENYIRETFKFQVTGCPGSSPRNSIWFGTVISEHEALDMAQRSGFEARYATGSGTQMFWLWFFKPGGTAAANH